MLEREPKSTSVNEWKKLASLLESVPLEKCSWKCNPVTKEWGWKAPENKIFRINQQFVVCSDVSDVTCMSMPLSSADLLREEHGELYKEFLEEAEGNEDEALRLLAEDVNDCDYGIPNKFFEGKWLIISPDFKQELQLDEQGNLKIPELMIKSDIEAHVDRPYFQLIKDVAPQSKTVTEFLFDSAVVQERWEQEYASAVLGKCKIELVDYCEKEKEFLVPEPIDDKKLLFPISVSTETRLTDNSKQELEDFKKSNNISTIFRVSGSDLLVVFKKIELISSKKKKPLRDVEF